MNTSFDLQKAKKISYFANIVFVVYVLSFIALYKYMNVTYMIYHSIPTLIAYFCMFILIAKEKLYEYVIGVYVILTIYMGATTLCLGVDYGFQLYIMSMLPIIFYVEYMAFRLHSKKPSTALLCTMMVGCYLACSGHAVMYAPFYVHDSKILKIVIYAINSLSVFGFLIIYTQLLVGMITQYQQQLLDMAHNDKLTGLYNRHYMIEYMKKTMGEDDFSGFAAMIDIDFFKGVNDVYGHDGGDFILREIAKLMQRMCEGCTLSRWGGEEFLLIGSAEQYNSLPNRLREAVEATSFQYGDVDISVTITVGVEQYHKEYSLEKWIQTADHKLYEGKKNGRNKVIF